MSDASTKQLLEMYMEEATAPLFLSGFFKSPARNFHNSEKVEIDVLRDDEDVAIVIQDLSVGARHNESTVYTNKGFTPPIYDEQGAVHAYDLIKRSPGENPFEDPQYNANAVREAFRIFRKLERKIRRALELQASQVLQTGALTLKDQTGTALFSLDFDAKATHLITVGTPWANDGATGDPLADLGNAAEAVRRDGKKRPDRLIFGKQALRRFLANAKVKAALDNRRFVLGEIRPAQASEDGASFRGLISVDHYEMEIWLYDGFYTDPQTGDHTPYVEDNNVIMLSSQGRLDLTFGRIPLIGARDPRAMPYLPSIRSPERGLDLTTNAWITQDSKHLMVSAGTRPLTIPTAIDTFARLTVA
jgi:hypothetical protein